MDISRPQFTHLRFDPQISEIRGSKDLLCKMKFNALVSPPDEKFDKFILGATCTFAFFKENQSSDVGSYLGEVLSVIENGSNSIENRGQLLLLSKDFYQGFADYILANAKYLGMEFAPKPDFNNIVDSWLALLIEHGFYKF